ncbi:MAG: SpoIIIAH-like family protein [Veillonellales bacterium]
MFVLSIRKGKATSLISVVLIIIVLLAAIIWVYCRNDQQTKVDRSNAIQVTRSVVAEQAVAVAGPDFFIEYRLERDKARSEKSDLLREIIKNSKTDNAREKAQETILKMVLEKQQETELESLIKTKGYSDALVFIKDNSVSAVVKTDSLSREEVVQVADVISRVSGCKAENITISAKP